TFLASLVGSKCKNVIIIGGNHDSAAMLDSAKELLDVLNIHVIGSVNNLTPADMCFELYGENDEVCGICMAVPYVREIELRNLLSEIEKDGSDKTIADSDLYSRSYKKLYEQVFLEAEKLRNNRKIPVIATGHLYAADLEGRLAEKKSNEKSDDGMKVLDVLGTLGNVPSSVFPPVSYLALGHVHYSTKVSGNHSIRYSGSPFVMGFDEADRPHHVLYVESEFMNDDERASLRVEKIETPVTYAFRRITGTLIDIKQELELFSAKKQDGEENPLFLELCYKRELGVNPQNFLEDSIRSLPAHVTVVSWRSFDNERKNSGTPAYTGAEGVDASEIKNLDDKEIFTQLILSKIGADSESEEGSQALKKFLPLFMQVAAEV
ncbi:MAG: hypothetical protein IJ727_07420, partial [Treponema sp.]|nr:hypothetical protein [Treponema sp.]